MLGRKPPLLTLSPEDLKNLQRCTQEIVDSLERAIEDFREASDKFALAVRELNRATVELKKARQKRDTIIRNTP